MMKITKEIETKIKGWVARDKDSDVLYLHETKPEKCGEVWVSVHAVSLDMELFPYLKWEDDPIEVELIIKRI